MKGTQFIFFPLPTSEMKIGKVKNSSSVLAYFRTLDLRLCVLLLTEACNPVLKVKQPRQNCD